VFSIRRDRLHLLLSILLMVAFAVIGRADLRAETGRSGKDVQLQSDAQYVVSSPALDIKPLARKVSGSEGLCLDCAGGREMEFRSEFANSRLDGETSARLPLSDLRGLLGRAPPARC
jgi:hypothetical protein